MPNNRLRLFGASAQLLLCPGHSRQFQVSRSIMPPTQSIITSDPLNYRKITDRCCAVNASLTTEIFFNLLAFSNRWMFIKFSLSHYNFFDTDFNGIACAKTIKKSRVELGISIMNESINNLLGPIDTNNRTKTE